MRQSKLQARAAHIELLARQHGIVVTSTRGASGRAYGREQRIVISPVRGPVSYAVALHALGHLIATGAAGPQHKQLIREILAWRWARRAALEWTERMDAAMQRSLGVYVRRLERRRRHIEIEPEAYFLLRLVLQDLRSIFSWKRKEG